MGEKKVGEVTNFFAKIGVAAIEITNGPLTVGDTIHILGHTSDFECQVQSIQIEHEQVDKGETGQLVGIKLPERVRRGDEVMLIIPD